MASVQKRVCWFGETWPVRWVQTSVLYCSEAKQDTGSEIVFTCWVGGGMEDINLLVETAVILSAICGQGCSYKAVSIILRVIQDAKMKDAQKISQVGCSHFCVVMPITL